jgi:Tfp pilus assembly protein PilW
MKTATLVIAALLIGGGVYLYSQHEAQAAQPSLEDQANKALASESNPYALRALSSKVRAAGFPALADLLDSKASAIEAFQTPQKPQGAPVLHPATSVLGLATATPMGDATLSFHQALLAGGVHAPRYPDGGYGPQPDPNLSPQNL